MVKYCLIMHLVIKLFHGSLSHKAYLYSYLLNLGMDNMKDNESGDK